MKVKHSSNLDQVRGVVKLEVVDTMNQDALVSRTLLTTQKQVQTTTKTLDGAIKRKENGQV